MPKKRFPQWVYRDGAEPDPRVSLANERTFLAWIRTALALFAAGIALEALALPVDLPFRSVAAATFVAAGLVAVVQSWIGWARTERAVRRAEPLPGSPVSSAILTAGMLLGIIVVAMGLLS